jgi:hypothetical protein
MAGPVGRLGLDQVVDVTGTGGPDSVDYWYGPTASVTDIRARLSRTLENPALYVDGAAPWLLSYHHDAAAVLHEMDDGATAAAYLDAFLAQPAWGLRYLGRELDSPSTLVADLTAWLYAPEELSDAGALATGLGDMADALSNLPALVVLFEGLPTGEAATTLSAFESHLTDLAAAIGTTSPSLTDPRNSRRPRRRWQPRPIPRRRHSRRWPAATSTARSDGWSSRRSESR